MCQIASCIWLTLTYPSPLFYVASFCRAYINLPQSAVLRKVISLTIPALTYTIIDTKGVRVFTTVELDTIVTDEKDDCPVLGHPFDLSYFNLR